MSRKIEAEGEAAERAAAFRADHSLGYAAIGDLVEVIESVSRIDVAVLDLGQDEHGMTMRDPIRDATVIAVARTPHLVRQRSTLAHELAHVLFEDHLPDHDIDWAARSPQEVRADAFARHLLIPIQAVVALVGGQERPLDLADLSVLCQRFLVSPAIAAIQVERAHLIDAARKQDWMRASAPDLAARFGWSDQYEDLARTSSTRRAPQRLLARTIAGYAHGAVSVETIARLRGTTADQARTHLENHHIAVPSGGVTWDSLDDLPLHEDDFADLDDADT